MGLAIVDGIVDCRWDWRLLIGEDSTILNHQLNRQSSIQSQIANTMRKSPIQSSITNRQCNLQSAVDNRQSEC
jgi:hypothetical protein